MARHRSPTWHATAAGVCLLLSTCGGGDAGASRPNVLLISIDSLRADHLGCYGYERDTSPAIDRLAEEGVLFELAVSSTSWTLPAHAALFTGLPDSVHGADRVDRALVPERRTLAEALHDAGWRTAAFWSGPFLHPAFGLDQGFEHYESCAGYDMGGAEGAGGGPPRPGTWGEAHAKSHADVTGPRVLGAVRRWLRDRRAEPFFLFVHLWDVHYDYVPPEPWDTRFADPDYDGPVDGRGLGNNRALQRDGLAPRDLEHLIALYDGEIGWTDVHVGKLLGLLEKHGLTESTLVVLTADHGEEFFEHGKFGHRRNLFEESVRVPLVVRFPGELPAGRRVAELVSGVDVAPTILELAGVPPLPATLGRSLVPLARGGEASASATAVSQLVHERTGARTALHRRDKKVLFDGEGVPVGLWDLEADPGEQRNLLDGSGAADPLEPWAQELLRELADLGAHHGAERATGEIPDDVREELRRLGYVDD